MISEKLLISYITRKGYKPASSSICTNKINKSGAFELVFYVNPHNLCWFADEEFLEYHKDNKKVFDNTFITNTREIKLLELI